MEVKTAQPDWADIGEEILCPLCEYNLRGLSEPTCPECGHSFDWPSLLDPHRRPHAYLFEHHPERNLWSLGKTLLGTVRPGTFWRSVYPTQPVRPRRLLIYALATNLPLLITWINYAIAMTELQFARYFRVRYMPGPISTGHFSFRQFQILLTHDARIDRLLTFGLAAIFWPWLTLIGLTIFRWPSKRADIRQIDVARCVVYSTDLSLYVWLVFLWLAAETCGFDTRITLLSSTIQSLWTLAVVFFLWRFIHRLTCAYRFYLRLDHALATVLAAQALSALAVWKLLLIMRGY